MQTCLWPLSDHWSVPFTSPHLSRFVFYGCLESLTELSALCHKKCKTLFNRTVRNCMLHPWLLYFSTHLLSEVSIMSNEYTWIWICHHMCIFTCKIARVYAHNFIYTENILTRFYYRYYHHCIYCTILHFMYSCLQLFCYYHFYFCSLFSFIIINFFITPKILLCYAMYAIFSSSLAIDWLQNSNTGRLFISH